MIKRYAWLFLVMLLVGPVLGFLGAGAINRAMPKRYESQATIEIKPWGAVIEGHFESGKPQPNFFATEMAKITSDQAFGSVVDALDLTQRWSTDSVSAVGILKKMVLTDQIRGTDLITIRVRSKEPSEARDIAMSVAKAYVEYRSGAEKGMGAAALQELRTQLGEQEERVEERRRILAKAISRAGQSPNRQDYEDAKRNFEAAASALQGTKVKLVAEEISSKMRDGGVVIHDEPVPGRSPVSPNVTLNLILGAVLGLLLSPLLALPVMWIASRVNPLKLGCVPR